MVQCSPTKAIAVYAALVTVIGLHFYVTHQQMEIDLQAQAVVPPLPPRAPCPVASNNITAQLITTAGSVPVVANKRKALVEAPPKSEEVYAVIPRIIHQTWKNKVTPSSSSSPVTNNLQHSKCRIRVYKTRGNRKIRITSIDFTLMMTCWCT